MDFKLNLIIITYCLNGVRIMGLGENIAYKKPAYQSSTYMDLKANNSVDGDFNQDYKHCAHGDKIYNVLNWLMVDLLGEYYVSEVILTPRSTAVRTSDTMRLDYVYVGISNSNISGNIEYPVYPLCRQSPYQADPTQNMPISCRPNSPPGRYVVVQQPTMQYEYLTICEIQVYGTNLNITLVNGTCRGNYYGDKCDKYCNCDKGVKCDQQGICPNGCDVNWDGEHCDNILKNFNSQLIGCMEFNKTSNDEYPRGNASSCIIACSGYGFTFAATKNTTSSNCVCTDRLNETSVVSNNLHCSNYSEYWDFYSVCPNGTYGYDCTLKCNCLNNGRCSYMEGCCEDGCASGWTGNSCNIRNCTVNNGGCNENENCVSNSSDLRSCQCRDGFHRTSAWLPCQTVANTSAIVGGMIGSLVGLCIIIALVIIFKCRKKIRIPDLTQSWPKDKFSIQTGIVKTASEFAEKKVKLQQIPEFIKMNQNILIPEYQNLDRTESQLKLSKEENKLNRFRNILPHEHNRVKLKRKLNDIQSDYINASYIEGIIETTLIAAQAPVKNGVTDFWNMIWQKNIGIIIMLCNYVERKKAKCEQYLPEERNLRAGEFTIHQYKTILWPSFKMTKLQVSDINDQQRSLIHLHFTEWPDHGVPNNVFYLLDFCRRCQKFYEREKCGVLVHCSAGVGRTGSFLAIYDLLVKGHQGLDLSVPETVNNLRRQRMKMVEKQAQYNFIYEALNEEVKLGPTSFSKEEFLKFYNNLKDGKIERSHLLHHYRILSGSFSNNEYKTGSMSFIKFVTSAYNFTLLSSNVHPAKWDVIPDTQCIIMFDRKDMEIIVPKADHPIINGQVCISLVNETNSEWGKVFEVQKKGDNVSNYENVVVNAYINTNASKEKNTRMCLVDKKGDYLDFLTFMELFSQLPNDANIVIILGNNQMLGYFFVAACNIISQLKVYDEIAILQNLCELCKVTEYQPSQISYEKQHQIVYEFLSISG